MDCLLRVLSSYWKVITIACMIFTRHFCKFSQSSLQYVPRLITLLAHHFPDLIGMKIKERGLQYICKGMYKYLIAFSNMFSDNGVLGAIIFLVISTNIRLGTITTIIFFICPLHLRPPSLNDLQVAYVQVRVSRTLQANTSRDVPNPRLMCLFAL